MISYHNTNLVHIWWFNLVNRWHVIMTWHTKHKLPQKWSCEWLTICATMKSYKILKFLLLWWMVSYHTHNSYDKLSRLQNFFAIYYLCNHHPNIFHIFNHCLHTQPSFVHSSYITITHTFFPHKGHHPHTFHV